MFHLRQVPSYVWFTLLLAFVHCCTSSTLGEVLGEKLQDFANEGLGWQQFQDYLDNDVTFSNQPLDAPTLAKRIAESMSEKLEVRISAIKELQQEIENLYNTGQNQAGNPFADCCNVPLYETDRLLNTEVNYDAICTVGQGVSSSDVFLPLTITDIMKEQYREALGIKYAFFGSEEGVMFNYPSLRVCQNSYDPRFRPWYVETSTPEPKDVVVVVDQSGSMRLRHDGNTLMDIAKEAATTVLETMNPNDRVGLVAFSDYVRTPSGTVSTSTCYRDELAKASSQNKDYLKEFISTLSASGGTTYSIALDAAFDYFTNSPENQDGESKRDRVILFLTDGEPNESFDLIYQKIKDRNTEFNNSIVILTYGLGEKLNQNQAGLLLQNMADQIENDPTVGEVTTGIYTPVTNPSNLRADMGSYYDFFLKQSVTEPVFSIPYLDAFGTGLLISMCLPVSSLDSLKGVTCMDLSVDDMLSDIAYFREGESSYAFIIDGSARVLTHPLLPSPSEITNSPYFIYLDSLEPRHRIEEISNSMTSGQNGSLEQSTLRTVNRGNVLLEGTYTSNVHATYSWYPIAGTSFSICIVVVIGENQTSITWTSAYPDYTYHRLDLATESLDMCKLFSRAAITGSSSVTFAARAFEDPFVYLYSEETSNTLNEYETYLRGSTEVNPGFKEGIRDTLAVTDYFDGFMRARVGFDLNVAWSYVSTDNGIHRNYPGAEIPKNYDATLRTWNLRSKAHKGQVTVSTSYEDAFGAGTVVTLSKALYEGVKGGTHTTDDKVLAVLGMDFTVQYFYSLMTESTEICSSYDCMVVDNAGFIITHKDWETILPDTYDVALASYEPQLAYQLIDLGFMNSQGCVNVVKLRDQYVWLISIPSIHDGTFSNQYLEIHEIENTNLFLLVKKSIGLGHCKCDSSYSECVQGYTCYCPCYERADIYRYCEGVFEFTSDTFSPCSPPAPVVSFDEVNTKDLQLISTLEECSNYDCEDSGKNSPGECNSVLTCSWCVYYEDGTSLDSVYCTTSSNCPGGSLTYSPDDESESDEGSSQWWIGPIIALIAVGVIMFAICKYKSKNRNCQMCKKTNEPTTSQNRPANHRDSNVIGALTPTAPAPNHTRPPPRSEVYANAAFDHGYSPPPPYSEAEHKSHRY